MPADVTSANAPHSPPQPLAGVRVLDLSRVLAGPWAGQLLADYGADVLKVERPGAGDDTRHWGPPFLQTPEKEDTAEAAYYLSANRNKQSVTIDFTRPEGQQLVRPVGQCGGPAGALQGPETGIGLPPVLPGGEHLCLFDARICCGKSCAGLPCTPSCEAHGGQCAQCLPARQRLRVWRRVNRHRHP